MYIYNGKLNGKNNVTVHCYEASGSMRAYHAAGPGSILGRNRLPG